MKTPMWEINRQANTVSRVGGGFVADLNGVGLGDARIISAAPDLLDVLRTLVDGARPLPFRAGEGAQFFVEVSAASIEAARAAIRKAEGR